MYYKGKNVHTMSAEEFTDALIEAAQREARADKFPDPRDYRPGEEMADLAAAVSGLRGENIRRLKYETQHAV